MLRIEIPKRQLDALASDLSAVPQRAPYGLKLCLNVLAEHIGKAQTQMIIDSIDRPTPMTRGAVRVTYAKEDDLQANIWLKSPHAPGPFSASRHWLEPLIKGGARGIKGFEGYLGRNRGDFFGVPTFESPNYDADQYGNLSRGAVNKIISQFKLFNVAAGFDANRTTRSKLFPVWERPERGNLQPAVYERYEGVRTQRALAKQATRLMIAKALAKKQRVKGAAVSINRMAREMYPRDIRPIMVLVRKAPQYQQLLPWFETAQKTIDLNIVKAREIAVRYATRGQR